MHIELQHHCWESEEPIVMHLPDRWHTRVLHMKGDEAKGVTGDDYREHLSALRTVIKGKKDICILFDDLTRPTRVFEVVPYLVEVLEQCGIRDEQVRFICAVGTHAALDNTSLRKKLGQEVLERFPVYNHNPYENCREVGVTNLGTPVIVNREYLSCDARIGIGALLPHPFCGFSGGPKIVLPGISHIDATAYHHGMIPRQREGILGLGRYQDNPLLEDVHEFGRIARLDAKIDVLVNTRGDHVGVCSPSYDAREALMGAALRHYSTSVPGKADIVFANTYAKSSEAGIAISQAVPLLKDTGGDVVLLCDVDAGQAIHYLFGRFGNTTWGRLGSADFCRSAQDPRLRRLFVYSRHKDLAGSVFFGGADRFTWTNDLGALVTQLDAEYGNESPDAFILPDATIQLMAAA